MYRIKAVMKRVAVTAAIAAVALAAPATVSAAPITVTAPTTFSILFDGNVGGTPIPELTAQADFNFTGFTDTNPADGNTEANFIVTLTNTTSSPVTSRVTGLGFDIEPDATGGNVSGLFTNFLLDGAYPNNFGPIEVCVNSGGNSCQGGGNGGVTTGNSGQFNLRLIFSGVVNSIALDNFGVRYQSITGVRAGTSGTGSGTPTPEPGTLMLMGGGMAAAFARWRKTRRDSQI